MSVAQQPIKVEYTVGSGSNFPTNFQVAVTTTAVPAAVKQVVNPALPTYAIAGTVYSGKEIYGTVSAAGASTVINLSSLAVFSTAVYWLDVYDTTSFVRPVITAMTANSFTFTSTAGHGYAFVAKGS